MPTPPQAPASAADVQTAPVAHAGDVVDGVFYPSSVPRPVGQHAGDVVDGVFYPCSDGRGIAQNNWQGQVILHAAGDLGAVHPEALVAAAVLVYPEKGNRYRRSVPDVLVALGLGMGGRWSYKVWVEGKPPDWVLDAAPSPVEEDRLSKQSEYAAMRAREYWLFDPKGDVFPRGTPRLRGYALENGEYRPLESRLEDGVRMIRSEVLDLGVRAEGDLLRFWNPATREDVWHHGEAEAAALREAAHADSEAARAQEEAAHADREAAARLDAEARASREAAAAEARVAELEAALQRLARESE